MNVLGLVSIIIPILLFILWALWDIRREVQTSNEIKRQIIFHMKQIEEELERAGKKWYEN